MIYIRIPIKFISCYWPPTIHLLKHPFTFSPESWSVINSACLWMDPWSTNDHAMLRPYPTQLSGSNPHKVPTSFSRKFTFYFSNLLDSSFFHRWQQQKIVTLFNWRFSISLSRLGFSLFLFRSRFLRASASSCQQRDAVEAVSTQIYLLKLEIYILTTM